MTDRNVDAVCQRLQSRAMRGLEKYGVTAERGDLGIIEWITHAQEEALDYAVYLERIKGDVAKLLERVATLEMANRMKERELNLSFRK
jgi:hypothetical protein